MNTSFTLRSPRFWLLFSAACIIGFVLGKIDSSPHWDDTGVIVFAILSSCFILGLLLPSMAWLWALLIGGFIVGFNIILHGNYSSAASFLFSFTGSYIGAFFRKKIIPYSPK